MFQNGNSSAIGIMLNDKEITEFEFPKPLGNPLAIVANY